MPARTARIRIPFTTIAIGALLAAALSTAAPASAAGVPSGTSPIGALDSATASSAGAVTVSGWALDPSTTAAIRVRVLVDGKVRATTTASGLRADVGRAYPRWGSRHGVGTTITGVSAGRRTVCLVGVNVGRGADRTLACRAVTVPPKPAAKPAPAPTASPKPTPAPTPTSTPRPAPATSNPLAAGPALPTGTLATAAQAAARSAGRTTVADALTAITAQPSAVWLGDWYDDAQLASLLQRELAAARIQGRVPVFVTYAIPGRDCGQHSSGGLDEQRYRAWTATVAERLRGSGAAVIVEPDALAMLGDCAGQGDRFGLLHDAVGTLAGAGLAVYLDAGHGSWVPVERMAERLRAVGVERARGFALNVSNFSATAVELAYAERLRAALGGGAHYVIDTSRNGKGAQGEWCNPLGAALGEAPRATSDGGGLDALLWIKSPGQSDGTCNGGPGAGQWWEEQALRLIRNR